MTTLIDEIIQELDQEERDLFKEQGIKKLDEIDCSTDIFETFYKEGWKCEIYDEENDQDIEVPLTLVVNTTDMHEATGEEEFKDYPIHLEIGILNRDCHVSIAEDMSGESAEELGIEFSTVYDVHGYCGFAVYMLQRFLDTDRLNDSFIETLDITEAAIFTYECRFTGQTKSYPRFKSYDAASNFGKGLIARYGNMFMSLVGFELDRPVNLMGDTGWNTIELCHFGLDSKKAV